MWPYAPYRLGCDGGSLPCMGAMKWAPRGARRWRRHALAVGFAAVAVTGVAACEGGGLSSAAVALTTDETVTDALNDRKADVRWLSCTASFGDGDDKDDKGGRDTAASVDCQGETQDGKEITVTGEITHAINGACVRGNLTAKVDEKQVFRVDGLGDCDGSSPPRVGEPTRSGGPRPTVTVTVTTTVWCEQYPSCRPVEGK
ncbi:lipoprotein [Streptomyces malachitofuscus]|nr:lipoprotein [Streptomyces malachitofuscus]